MTNVSTVPESPWPEVSVISQKFEIQIHVFNRFFCSCFFLYNVFGVENVVRKHLKFEIRFWKIKNDRAHGYNFVAVQYFFVSGLSDFWTRCASQSGGCFLMILPIWECNTLTDGWLILPFTVDRCMLHVQWLKTMARTIVSIYQRNKNRSINFPQHASMCLQALQRHRLQQHIMLNSKKYHALTDSKHV